MKAIILATMFPFTDAITTTAEMLVESIPPGSLCTSCGAPAISHGFTEDRCYYCSEHEPTKFYKVGPASLGLKSKKVYLYGNTKLLDGKLWSALDMFPNHVGDPLIPIVLDKIELATETAVLEGKVLVAGVHNAYWQRSALVPLRWGAPRILVTGGLFATFGPLLREEPFRAARLWRYMFDASCDLVVSVSEPTAAKCGALSQPRLDAVVKALVNGGSK